MENMQPRIERQIDQYRNELEESLARLVAIPSVKGDAAPGMPFGRDCFHALEEATRLAVAMGFSTRNYEGYMLAIEHGPQPPQLDIMAHLDVVPAQAEDWQMTQPYAPRLIDGKLYGRGGADNKGPGLAALFAMKAIKDLGIPLSKGVRILFGTDEESGSTDLAYFQTQDKMAPMCFTPDEAFPVVNVEKGRFSGAISLPVHQNPQGATLLSFCAGQASNVIPAHAKAVLRGITLSQARETAARISAQYNFTIDVREKEDSIVIKATGRSGHVGSPQRCCNALTALLTLLVNLSETQGAAWNEIRALEALFPHDDFFGTAAGIAQEDAISGKLGIAISVARLENGRLTVEFDSRTPLCATRETMADVVAARCAQSGLTLQDVLIRAPHHVPEESAFVQILLRAYTTVTAEKAYCTLTSGGTYAHGLSQAVAFGAAFPGRDLHTHGNDEVVYIDDLLTAAKIYALAIVDICK